MDVYRDLMGPTCEETDLNSQLPESFITDVTLHGINSSNSGNTDIFFSSKYDHNSDKSDRSDFDCYFHVNDTDAISLPDLTCYERLEQPLPNKRLIDATDQNIEICKSFIRINLTNRGLSQEVISNVIQNIENIEKLCYFKYIKLDFYCKSNAVFF